MPYQYRYRRSRWWPVFAILLIVIALGFYRGWFALSGSNESEDGKVKVNVGVTVDPAKVEGDARKVGQMANDTTEKTLDTLQRKGTAASATGTIAK